MSEKGLLIVLSAPSGCGKSTVVHALMQRRQNVSFSVSATTRAPREGEVDGRDYFFVTRERFDEMVAAGEFLEYAVYVSNCYGTPRGAVEKQLADGRDVILDIDVQGAFQVRSAMPDAVLVFLLPPSYEELEKRLVLRGKDAPEVIAKRLEAARAECARAPEYDFRIVNDDVERAVTELESVIDGVKNERQ